MIWFAALLLATPLQHDPRKTRIFRQAAEMEYGPCIAATVGVQKDNVVPKGLVIRLDREKQAYLLFDTELLRVAAAWTGGWLHLAGRAYADDSNDYPWFAGELAFDTARAPGWASSGDFKDPRPAPGDGPLPRAWARYDGLYLHGDTVTLAYTVQGVKVLESPRFENGAFVRRIRIEAGPEVLLRVKRSPQTSIAAPFEVIDGHIALRLPARSAAHTFRLLPDSVTMEPCNDDLVALTKGGPGRWPGVVESRGVLGKEEGAYAVDAIGLPDPNPWKSWIRFTGIDFLPDGRAALCTWSGDVWIASGLDAGLAKVTWKRFAAGVGQPMGLKVVDGVIHTAARDQISRLHDLDGDGEADFYENFNNEIKLGTNFHEFVFDLQTDAAGNFYCAKGSSIWAGSLRMTDHHGALCRISKDGSKLDILATGLRAPNGVGVSPDGLITCSDNQGNWVPECPINAIRPGADYGFVGQGQKARPEREKPICWIPMSIDKSPGTQQWITDGRWGPLKGLAAICSYDCTISLLLVEKLASGGLQGGVVRFPFTFPSGVMRGRFAPADGQLYLAGLRGWSSRAARDACFQRVRWTGKTPHLPVGVVTRKGALEVTFSAPLDPASTADPENIGALVFNVVRTGGYGSPEFSLADPKKRARDPLEVKSTKLSADGRTLAIELPDLKPVTNLVLKFRLKGADGSPVNVELDYTLHEVPE
jgi:hypothetical protein